MKTFGVMFGTLACAAALAFAAADNPLTLWYNSDAAGEFTNALPIGNGYMGGIIYGGVTKDIIGLNESTGTERTFRTADTGDSIEEIAQDTERRLSVSEGERYLKFTAAKSGFYKVSASGTGTVTVYDPEGAGQSFVGADREMIVEASSGDVLWIRCASEDDGDPLTVTVTLFTAKVETPVAVTGAAADVTESSVSLSGIFTVPKTDASYSCGIMLLAGGEEADRDSIETGV